MASLTPGTLLKLLQSMNNPASSDHRSPTLQVTAIAPATADLCPSNGFYLQLSDSLNSTYVSLSDRDADAVDSLQVGQLVHLDRLLPSHPVPKASNLRPIPFLSRSPPPLMGSPQPLLLSFSSPSNPSSFVIQPSNSNPPPRAVLSSKENLTETTTTAAPIPSKKRFSSPSPRATPASSAPKRHPSPTVTPRCSSGSRSSSPVPSKCVVPSLVAAKEESRKAAREPAIVVPSRYRQPSPGAGRRGVGASPVAGRKGSMSPGGRRLSGEGGGSGSGGGGKKKGGVVVAGIGRVSVDGGMGRGVRKSWEDNSGAGLVAEEKEKEKGGGGRCKVDQQAILRTQVVISSKFCSPCFFISCSLQSIATSICTSVVS